MTTSSGTPLITLPSDEQILITRELAAAPPLVYRAWTTPELVKRWWSGGHGPVTVADIDLRIGGTWRFVISGAGGYEVAFHGEYREIAPNERLVYTEVFEGAPAPADGDAGTTEPPLDIVTFAPSDSGGTTLTLLVECHTKALRDLILESGMEAGVQGQMAALEEVARSLT
jgi:uncharacterized protein YndB with AHSA1/START domain